MFEVNIKLKKLWYAIIYILKMTSYNNNIEKYRQHYQQNKETIKKYYERDKEQIREKQRLYFRNYHLLNKEKIIANCQRRYYGFTCVAHGISDIKNL